MDELTLGYYATHAAEVVARYESALSPLASVANSFFPHSCRLLDIGAGSGRDMAELNRQGYDVYGVEPVTELRQRATNAHPELEGRIAEGSLPALDLPFGGEFDGVVCSAVLMHVPESYLFDSAFAIRKVLKQHGRLLISVPGDRPNIDKDGRDSDDRLFMPYLPDFLQLLFERLGFQQIGRWETVDTLGRKALTWVTLLFELRAGSILRPIDQIEGILNRDKKVATYKLALFRALAEIATTQLHTARWLPTGKVGVPIRAVAQKWIEYYWPIFSAQRFYPQLQGETEDSRNGISFRKSVTALAIEYRNLGGLTGFVLESRSTFGSVRRKGLYLEALSKIEAAIKSGPVTYAGGSLQSGRVFEFAREAKLIVFDAAIWRELNLLGHWVLDAVILRWAEKSERIGRGFGVKASEVVDLLLTAPNFDRDTAFAQKTFGELPDKVCVWSNQELGRFDVDHVIPFSLWGDNSLWNLLPAHPSINRNKSHRLPSASLIQGRRAQMVRYWHILREADQARFDADASRLIGSPLEAKSWESILFARVREAVEITALQRGIERWECRACPEFCV